VAERSLLNLPTTDNIASKEMKTPYQLEYEQKEVKKKSVA